MAAGLQVRDTSGRVVVDLTTRVTKYVQSFTLGASAETTVPVSGLTPENNFLVCDVNTTPWTGPFFRIEAGQIRYSYSGTETLTVHVYSF